jgi:glycerophosphoryl diester phosphodiesterase
MTHLEAQDSNTQRRGVQVIAHRGAWRSAPENTLENLQRCIDGSAEASNPSSRYAWAEVDVRRTADGHHVLMHDDMLDRTTTGHGPVSDASLAEVRSLDAGSWFGEAFAGVRVPTLAEALRLARGQIGLYLDARGVDPARLVADILDAGMAGQAMVIAEPACHGALAEAAAGRIRLVTFFDGEPDQIEAAVRTKPCAIVEVPFGRMSPELVSAARAARLAVECFTLGDWDRPACWRQAGKLGADWIMTDHPQDATRELDAPRAEPGRPDA